ncbi:MAG: FAD-dependent thymidylate synthase [Bacteroidota bacterium]
MQSFLSPEPTVKLDKFFPNPFKNVVATARTCYSSKGVIKDEQIEPERWKQLAKSLYEAGHHTTFQHAYFQFILDNVSRHFIWSFLHSHPFYNSEQVSQRYVEIKPGMCAIPPLEGEALEVYQRTIDFQVESYHKLIDLLKPLTADEYYKRFPGRRVYREKYTKDIKKKAQEVARYVMPIATFAYLYHTISGITLLRYYRLCEQYDTPLEQKIVIRKMVEELLKIDPLYEIVLEGTLELDHTPEHDFLISHADRFSHGGMLASKAFLQEFDESLDGRVSKLIDYKRNNEKILAQSVREVLGVTTELLNDEDAIDLVLNPAKNKLLGESLVLTTHSKLARALYHPSYTFRRKLSHAADSQDQRHRMTPGSRPVLHAHYIDTPDYITPELVKQDSRVQRCYDEIMARAWEGITRLLRLGVNPEYAMYLLPNAVAVRFTESADLLNLHHKHVMRLCYNAQEEIWRASLDEATQIREVNPLIGKYLLPPCTVRAMAGMRPICPEGARFCGEIVWKMDISEYERVI